MWLPFSKPKSKKIPSDYHTEDGEQKVKELDISEPVITISKSFREPNRWVYSRDSEFVVYHSPWSGVTRRGYEILHCIEDISTKCTITFKISDLVDVEMGLNHIVVTEGPLWITGDEKDYLEKEIWKWYSEHVEKVKQNKREEVKKLYGVD